MDDAMRLFGLKAIVTGAANGIGEAVARTFVKHGAHVLSVDSPDSGIETLFSSVHGITGFAADLSDSEAPPPWDGGDGRAVEKPASASGTRGE